MRTTRRLLVLAMLLTASSIAHATDLVAKRLLFESPPRVDRLGRIGCEVQNTNVLPALQFYVRFLIRFGTTTVYQRDVNAANLIPNATTTVWADDQFKLTVGGSYTASAEVVFQDEIDPSDNTVQQQVTPLPRFISIAEAVAKLDANVLNALPERNTLRAFLVRPPSAQPDSVHEAGTLVTLRDGSMTESPFPSYLFFVDRRPGEFWTHPAVAVRVPAEAGSSAPTRADSTDHPFMVNGVEPSFGPNCGPNPDRVRGTPTGCTPPPAYSTVRTTNTLDWAFVFTGRVIQDVDDNTMRHDLKKVIDRLNGSATGPRITDTNIRVRRGNGDSGMTKAQLIAALDSLKGRACRKLYIKYIGHGTRQGLVLKKAGKSETEIMTWDEFADLVKSISSGEVCIDITACFSGNVTEAMQKAGVRGTVVSSSDKNTETPQGEGSGTYWEAALAECSADTSADVNGDGMVHLKEAALWVLARKPPNDPARRPGPQVVCLNDSVKNIVSGIEVRTSGAWDIRTPGGSLVTSVERFCIRTSFKRETGRRDTTVWRNNIYIENKSAAQRNADRTFEIVAICGRGSDRTERVITTIMPQVGPRGKICVGVLPEGCSGMIVREVPRPRRMPMFVQADSAQVVDQRSAIIVTDPGDYFRVEHTFVDVNESASYTAGTVGPQGWDVGQDPAQFRSRADSTTMVDAWGWIPKDSTNGGDLLTTVVNTTTYGVTHLTTRVLAPTFAGGPAPIPVGHHRNVVVPPGIQTISRLSNSFVELLPDAGLAGAASGVDLRDVIIESRSMTAPPFTIDARAAGSLTLEGVVLAGLRHTNIIHRDVAARHVVVDAPITLDVDQGTHDVAFLSSFGAKGHGVTLRFAQGVSSMDCYGLMVVEPDSLDVVVQGQGQVRCIDCDIDIANTGVAFGASLTQMQNISAVVSDRDGEAVRGRTLDVVGRTGDVLGTATTNDDGVATFESVVIASMTDVLIDHRPVRVRLNGAGGAAQWRDVAHSGWTQVFFEDSTSTSVDDIQTSNARVAPMPLDRDGTAHVYDGRGIRRVEVYDVRGVLVAMADGSGAERVAVPLSGIPTGWYAVVVVRDNGSDRLPVIVR